MTTFTVAQFCDAILDPTATELLSAVNDVALVEVEIRDEADVRRLGNAVTAGGSALAALPGAGLPCVVVAVVPVVADGPLPSYASFGDVVVAASDTSGREGLEAIVGANPLAATTFSLLLRSPARTQPGRRGDGEVMQGLVAESAAFSVLQSGAEFARWRAATPASSDPGPAERVRVERTGDVLDIVLARPGRRNALDTLMRDALAEALTVAIAQPDLRIRLSGDGPAFCAGGDLDEFGSRPDPATAHVARVSRSLGWLVHQLAERLEVRLHGTCLGSGIEVPAFAGRIVARPDTVLGLPEIALGLIPGAGGTVSLPRRIGRQRTAYLALSGLRATAETALAWGLIDDIQE